MNIHNNDTTQYLPHLGDLVVFGPAIDPSGNAINACQCVLHLVPEGAYGIVHGVSRDLHTGLLAYDIEWLDIDDPLLFYTEHGCNHLRVVRRNIDDN